MPKAIWNGIVIAESDVTEVVEDNHYFPPDSIKREYFFETEKHTRCPWKGIASYYTLKADDGEENTNGAWFYPNPMPAAENIKNFVAFYDSVQIVE